MSAELLTIQNLSVCAQRDSRAIPLVTRISFSLKAGENLALIGESGAGKTTVALSVTRLLPHNVSIAGGSIRFDGLEIAAAPPSTVRPLLGSRIAIVFQDPMNALNPFFTIGYQIVEQIRLHRDVSRKDAREHAATLLGRVGIPDPANCLKRYAHQLSGGMRQRALIAMAISCDPELLIADEPTTALDPTVQMQVLTVLSELQKRTSLAIILVTHDVRAASLLANWIGVLYGGRMVEFAPVAVLQREPRHPYTRALLRAAPRSTAELAHLQLVEGKGPETGMHSDKLCPFLSRCTEAVERCREEFPPERTTEEGGKSLCWLA